MEVIRKKLGGMKKKLVEAETEARRMEKELEEVNAKADSVCK